MAKEARFQTIQCCSDDRPVGETPDPLLLLIILIAALWWYSRRNLISGVAKVTSGNRLIVKGQKIRIYAMFGLYPRQPWYDQNGVEHDGGSKSKAGLAHKIDGKKVKCWYQPNTPLVFGSKLCRVYHDGEDVAEWMIRNGYAVASPSKVGRALYARAEKRAKKEGTVIHGGTFDHPLLWYLNGFRDSPRVKDIVKNKQLESLDDSLEWSEIFKWTGRVIEAAGDGGLGTLTTEIGEYNRDWRMD